MLLHTTYCEWLNLDGLIAFSTLALGIATIVILTAKFRLNAFLALITVAVAMGLALGLGPAVVAKDVVDGFGGTLGYVGLIFLASTIIGVMLDKTGATVVIAESTLKLLSKSRVLCCRPLAAGIAGYLVAPPVACNDTAFIILSPVARALGSVGGYGAVVVSLILAAGAYTSFKLVFPAAPLFAAAIFKANLPNVIILGIVTSLPVFAVGVLWAQFYGRRVLNKVGSAEEEPLPMKHENLPTLLEAGLMIALPVALILLRSTLVGSLPETSIAHLSLNFVGDPVIAMMLGIGFGFFVARRQKMETISEWVGEGLTKAAPVVAVVGAGGVLGKILLDSNIGSSLGSSLTTMGLPGAVVIFLVAAMIKTAQGSSIVTMVTAPTILLPLLPALGITPTLATLLVSAGAMVSVNVNDSFFWVVTGASHMTISQGMRGLTLMSVAQGTTALLLLLLIKAVFPGL
jgi:GntP family gluconate:H+ symporter